MLELRIKITRENAEKVAQLIKELVQLDAEGLVVTSEKTGSTGPGGKNFAFAGSIPNYLAPPHEIEDLEIGWIVKTERAKHVGSWGQFNSFFPVKAVLRVLCHMVSENGGNAVNLQDLVDKSTSIFRMTGMGRLRGFPSSRKESAVGRLVWHFITTAHEMGLVKIEGAKEIPVKGWKDVSISPTKESYEFAKLNNLIFEERGTEQLLSGAESKWLLNHLKKIDDKGYKEYSFLKKVFGELKKGNTDIASWLKNNQHFIDYVKSWSKKTSQERELKKQVANVAATFAQSKIALLRELGVISNKRNDYTVIGDLEVVL